MRTIKCANVLFDADRTGLEVHSMDSIQVHTTHRIAHRSSFPPEEARKLEIISCNSFGLFIKVTGCLYRNSVSVGFLTESRRTLLIRWIIMSLNRSAIRERADRTYRKIAHRIHEWSSFR